jgi:serine/threonine protein kinase
MGPCLDENELIDFVAGRLSDEMRRIAEAHLDECPGCLEWVTAQARALTETTAPGYAATAPTHQRAIKRVGARTLVGAQFGRYEVVGQLGAGAMGVVYRAFDPALRRHIALKVVVRTMTAAATLNTQMEEAHALARLAHPNVVAVYDVGIVGEQLFIAMELIDGQTLGAWLAAAPRRFDEIVAVYREAAKGMAAAHSAGVIHRDFKPENVLVGAGRVAVTDFGLACAIEQADAPAGRAPVQAGTPAYMAPEQIEGRSADERTDIFNFCASLYHSLFGELPFVGQSLDERLAAIQAGRLRPPGNVHVPSWLRSTLVRGLLADPTRRPGTMTELIHALELGERRRKRARE